MKYKFVLVICAVMFCLYSCKKATPAPTPATLILGKWYAAKQVSVLSRNGAELSTFSKTNFTNDDFVEYYNDGSGYYSRSTSSGPSLTEFNYTLTGTTITKYTGAENAGIPESITSVTSTGLAIHAVSKVSDPNDPSLIDTEVDDLTYTK